MNQGTKMTWTIDAVQREALVFGPTVNTPNEKHPLVFAFHGHGGEMENTATQMNFQTVARSRGGLSTGLEIPGRG